MHTVYFRNLSEVLSYGNRSLFLYIVVGFVVSKVCFHNTQLAEVFDSVIHDAMKSLGYCCGGRVCSAAHCNCALGVWLVAKEVTATY